VGAKTLSYQMIIKKDECRQVKLFCVTKPAHSLTSDWAVRLVYT
jgi:hypothetical protein